MSATTHILNRNMPYLKQQFSALLRNTSPVITLICLVTAVGYLLSFSETAVLYLTVTPGYILPNTEFWVWTAFTFCFMELHWWEVLVDVITVGLCGKMIEPLWGQMEMFKFFALSNIGVSILTTMYYLFNYMITKDPLILFDVHIHGLAGYVAGICVAVRQIMPDHLIFKTRYGKLTNRNVPLTVLILSIVFWVIKLLDGTYPAMFASGLLVSWVYLRFYQHHPNGRGDSSDSFTFASFFPSVTQPVISILVNPIYMCCLKMSIVKPPAPPRISSAACLMSISVSMPGVDPHDIERRRQIALKALSERLKSTENSRHNQLPKSFPTVAGQHHQPPHKHHGQHQHHHHQHLQSHSHSHGHSHDHPIGGGHSDVNTPAFLTKSASTIPAQPITTARTEPRMISTMSPIAIPMPAPPPKAIANQNAIIATDEHMDIRDKALLIDMDSNSQ
ncbi:transmembrane protein 115 [Glossina fuscipes]|uniref:Transmembrane protein 115 n=1 Tax=Glossina fuscipes TaxID=7396 RepID=A0A8U0WF10_9MUSC|nr:transmembrane protein 115 [Glossina fuscipes]